MIFLISFRDKNSGRLAGRMGLPKCSAFLHVQVVQNSVWHLPAIGGTPCFDMDLRNPSGIGNGGLADLHELNQGFKK